MGSFQQDGYFFCRFGYGIFYFIISYVFYVFFRVINNRFQMHDHIPQLSADLFQFFWKESFLLLHCNFQGGGTFGIDDVHDGFRLDQIDSAV